ncbi:MAG: hypothetical protein JW704_01055, partial [Anaerolineaceae bacterium]|nr:hypothetical protein [Anaerolineaceae bacterium]
MSFLSEIQNYIKTIPAELKESKGVYELTVTVAERKAFLSTQKLQYQAKFRIIEDPKLLRFTEMLKESGAGISSGSDFDSPGFGFKTETFKSGGSIREGTIEEQSTLFGKKYEYRFDFKTVREKIKELAT